MPPVELGVLEDDGKLILRGCLVGDDDPNLHCRKCKHEWSDDNIDYRSWIDSMVAP
jgi:hypothetical protein